MRGLPDLVHRLQHHQSNNTRPASLPSRREFLESAGVFAATAFAGPALGVRPGALGRRPPNMPSRIRWIVPFSPGGGYDVYSRLIVPYYEARLGAEIVVENVTGAAGAVGAEMLKGAPPDGTVLGILPTPGLLVAALTGQPRVPNPSTDFTLIGRVAPLEHILFTGARSGLSGMAAVFEVAERRQVVFGVSEVASSGFVVAAVLADLLGIPATYLAGYPGSRQTSLAVARGDADVASLAVDAVLDRIVSGDLIPLMQITAEPIEHPSVEAIPVLGGTTGLAASRARGLRRDSDRSRRTAAALIGMGDTGRVVAGPPGMPAELALHLSEQLGAALTEPALRRSAAAVNRPLAWTDGATTRATVEAAVESAQLLLPVVRRAMSALRG